MLIGLFDDPVIYEMIRNFDNEFSYSEFEKERLGKFLPKRMRVLKKNILDVISILYIRGQASLFDIDTTLEEEMIELGGRSCGISRILSNLKTFGVVAKEYPYRLTKRHRNTLDQIYLKNLFS